MGKSKNNKNTPQKRETPQQFIRRKARSLEQGPSYMWPATRRGHGEECVAVTRRRPKGNLVAAFFRVDLRERGLTEVTVYHSLTSELFAEKLKAFMGAEAEEVSYGDVHALLYDAVRFGRSRDEGQPARWELGSCLLKEEDGLTDALKYQFGPEHYPAADGGCSGSRPVPEPTLLPEEEYDHKKPSGRGTVRLRTISRVLEDENCMEGIADEAIARIKKLKRASAVSDLTSALNGAIRRSREALEADELDEVESPTIFHSVVLLGELPSPQSVKALLELLRQPEALICHHFGERGREMIARAIYKASGGDLAPAEMFLRERGLDGAVRSIVLHEIRIAVGIDPMRRDEAIALLGRLFKHKLELQSAGKPMSTLLTSVAASLAADLGASELQPEIEALYEAGRIDPGITGPISTLAKRLKRGSMTIEPARLLSTAEIYGSLEEL